MKQIKIIFTFVIFSVIGFAQALAGDTTSSNPDLPVELKYAGIFKNQPLIQLNFTGASEDRVFSISITDEAGLELYNGDVKGHVFSKQFLLNTNELGDAVLQFVITGKKTGKKAVYKVSRQQQQVTAQMNIVKL